jgi:hypothetical protein
MFNPQIATLLGKITSISIISKNNGPCIYIAANQVLNDYLDIEGETFVVEIINNIWVQAFEEIWGDHDKPSRITNAIGKTIEFTATCYSKWGSKVDYLVYGKSKQSNKFKLIPIK